MFVVLRQNSLMMHGQGDMEVSLGNMFVENQTCQEGPPLDERGLRRWVRLIRDCGFV